MKKLIASVLLFALALSFSACGKNAQQEDSGGAVLQTYRLPTEWTVTMNGRTRDYTVSFEGSTATVTSRGETVLVVTTDEAGNVVHREDADGSTLSAVYNAEGTLTETILRDADGAAKQRIEYDANGRAVRELTRGRFDEMSLRVFTYGEDGELLTETQYGSYGYHTFAYHENGERAEETVYLLDFLPYCREEFDENGNLTWEYSYDKDGNISYRCEYDAEGNTVAEYDKDGNPYVNERYEYKYDENGNRTEYRIYRDDGTLYELYTSDYDENGNEIAWQLYHEGNTLTREVFRTYGDAGMLIKTVQKDYRVKDGESELIDSFEIEYDEAGNQTHYAAYDGTGALSSYTEMKHEFIGGKWVMTLYTGYSAEGELRFRQEMTHDERGNETEARSYDADGTLSSRTVRTYDERDNQIESVLYDGDGNVIERTLSAYDEHNNLLEQTVYKGEEISSHIVCENHYEYDEAGRLVGESRATVEARYTYTYKEGSGLRTVKRTDGDGNVAESYETVRGSDGNPQIVQRTRRGHETRFEYAWSEAGGLLSRVEYDEDKQEIFRVETGGHIACALTEVQYRRLLDVLLEMTAAAFRGEEF